MERYIFVETEEMDVIKVKAGATNAIDLPFTGNQKPKVTWTVLCPMSNV